MRVSGVVPSNEYTGPRAPRLDGRTAVGSCPDVEGVRHQGEHLFVGVIAGSKELPFGLMSAPPCAERRECCPIKADNFVGVVALAACFVPWVALD